MAKKELKQANNKAVGYIRVSSKDQASGFSLDEQEYQIKQYAISKGLEIVKFFGGVESASKPGREMFAEMLKELKSGKYSNAIFHSTSRSGRNPKEQSQIYELMLEGYEFHFVQERLSTNEPIGRNMVYMLWGMASGYSENLKAEVNKGIMGMLRQGRCPTQCPIGYRDAGKGIKELDEVQAPLVKKAFELFSKGDIDIQTLHSKLSEQGLVDKQGKKIHFKTLYKMLRNPFYYGLIRYNGESFAGSHTAIIDKHLFDKVQDILNGKSFKHKRKFSYLFQHLVVCKVCGKPARCMSAKGRYKYYSCRNLDCKFNLREEVIEDVFFKELKQIEFNEDEVKGFIKAVEVFRSDLATSKADEIKHIDLEIMKLNQENERLLSLFIQQDITNEEYKVRKSKNTNREIELNERKTALSKADQQNMNQIAEIGKLLAKPSLSYHLASDDKKVSLVKSLVENFEWRDGQLHVTWKNQYKLVAERNKNTGNNADVLVGSATENRTPICWMKTNCPNH